MWIFCIQMWYNVKSILFVKPQTQNHLSEGFFVCLFVLKLSHRHQALNTQNKVERNRRTHSCGYISD